MLNKVPKSLKFISITSGVILMAIGVFAITDSTVSMMSIDFVLNPDKGVIILTIVLLVGIWITINLILYVFYHLVKFFLFED